MSLTTVRSVRDRLAEALESIPPFKECALLGYPDHHNVGDHLIWLGALRWICETRRARVSYLSSIGEFSQKQLETGSGPIFMTGGGNFGDLWVREQGFRDTVIRDNPGRPIVILPQSIHFADPRSIEPVRRVIDSHPDITIITRDSVSSEKSRKFFQKARLLHAPDMSFMLDGFFETGPRRGAPAHKILALRRYDREKICHFPIVDLKIKSSDWPAMNAWTRFLQKFIRRVPAAVRLPQKFMGCGPVHGFVAPEGMPLIAELKRLPSPELQYRSLRLMAQGAFLLRSYRLVLTDRLHGHVFSALLRIPSVLMPNAYHKNLAFYEDWLSAVPECRFASAPDEINHAVHELLR